MDTDAIVELLCAALEKHLRNPGALAKAEAKAKARLPPNQVANIDAALSARAISYRDVLAIQLAYGLCSEARLDLTKRHKGARGVNGVAGRLGAFLAKSHIRHVQDAVQNIGKNTPNLARGNLPQFDDFLCWASRPEATSGQLRSAFEYVCAKVAATARPVAAMPQLDMGSLNFGAVASLLRDMFGRGSQGAYEQFTVAALLHALVGQVRAEGYRVETKSLNASDRSSRVAGDVQILTGNRIVEAYEVTAAEWTAKVGGAEKAIRDNDLSRIHIVAAVGPGSEDELLSRLRAIRADVSVLDLQSFTSALLSALTRPHRAAALERLYEFLDRYQPDVGKVNAYVGMLRNHRLVRQA